MKFAPVFEPQIDEFLPPVERLLFESDAVFEGISSSSAEVVDEPKYVEIVGSKLTGLRLTGAFFDSLTLVDVILEDCEFSAATFMETNLLRVRFDRCRMSGFVASGVKGQDVNFTGCKLDGANFRMSTWERSQFVDCEMQESDFGTAKLTRSQLVRCRLEGAQFAQAKLDQVAFHGSLLDGLRGADSMKGAIIGSDQVLTLAPSILHSLGIKIDDTSNPI